MNRIFILSVFFFINISLFSAEIDSCYAKIIGKNFFENFTNQSNTTIKNIVENKYNLTTTFYGVNFNEGGFIIISADDRVSPVIYISYTGFFSDILQFIPPKQTIFKNYSSQIYDLIQNGNKNSEYIEVWDSIENKRFEKLEEVTPLILTKWKQSGTSDINNNCQGYNYYVPDTNSHCGCSPDSAHNKCSVGCGATAMAQILKYYNFAIIRGYNFYDWANMPVSLLSTSSEFKKELFNIGHLSADCGYFSSMKYCLYIAEFFDKYCASFNWPKISRKLLKLLDMKMLI